MPTHNKERPILFSGSMIRAILENRKCQTRRVVKLAGIDFRGCGGDKGTDWNDPSSWGFEDEDGNEWALAAHPLVDHVIPCPHGVPGDTLWVRESFSAWFQCIHWYNYKGIRDDLAASNVFYRATHHYPDDDQKWVPSIFMPRWASRITLEITGVRVERVQEISEADAHAEGCGTMLNESGNAGWSAWPAPPPPWSGYSFRNTFRHLWDTINAKRGYGWDANPWVWVVEFRRMESNNG